MADDRPKRRRISGAADGTARTAVYPGRLVVLVGPDGVGKTTVARALVDEYTGPTAYFHFLPPIGGSLASAPDRDPGPPPPKAPAVGTIVLGWLRLFRNAARCWLSYLTTIRPTLGRKALVIGDRWIYGYIVQPYALRFYGPAWLAHWVVRLMPQPDLIVNLAAPAALVRSRKQELTDIEIERELLAWASLPLPHLLTVDAGRPPEVIAREVLSRLAVGSSGAGESTVRIA
jgi:thymidylate kinase